MQVIASLMKLAGGSPSFAAELNVDAFLEQVMDCRAGCRAGEQGGVGRCSIWGLCIYSANEPPSSDAYTTRVASGLQL